MYTFMGMKCAHRIVKVTNSMDGDTLNTFMGSVPRLVVRRKLKPKV